MGVSLYWVQAGGCGGDTMSFLGNESPDVLELFEDVGVEVLWHPSLSNLAPQRHGELLAALREGRQALDVLVVEGAVIRGPGGTGMYDCVQGRPRKDLISELAQRAQVVVALGTCASFGGIGGCFETEATGLQFERDTRGGFLGADFRARGGLPVINLPGCPAHPNVLAGALTALAEGTRLELDAYQRPLLWYGLLVHQGCVRNEYHEYRVEDDDFGQRGCLFFHLGCQGPLAYGPCNKLLWGRRSSKTRVGIPCIGCTQPDFPNGGSFFETRSIVDIPVALPDGVDRAHYLAYKGMAAAAAPERLLQRKTRL
ncbi:MAG: NADH:ubiquinone oxidoreductase [Armatimonadetes bacterium]|nr:NADH:ubiquinone oxidoreductase [Armatimonadota bacterium]